MGISISLALMRHLFPLRLLVRRLNFLLWLKSSTLTVRPEIRERKLDTKMTKELDTDPILISLLFFFSLGTKNERKREIERRPEKKVGEKNVEKAFGKES